MAEKDCAHFDFGDGTCPFGTSCFYRHAYRDGRLEVRSLVTLLSVSNHAACLQHSMWFSKRFLVEQTERS